MADRLARARGTTLLFYGCVFLLVYLMYLLFQPFLRSLAWAAILAAFFYPRYKRLERRFGKTLAASLGTTAVTLIIVVPFVLLTIAFIQEASQTVSSIDLSDLSSGGSGGFARLERGWAWLQRQRIGRNLGSLDNVMKQTLERVAGAVANGAGIAFRNMLGVIANLVIMLFALFFFFRDGDTIMSRLRRVLPVEAAFREKWIAESADLIRASISSGLIVALAQGALGGVAFAALGLGAAVFWGVTMAFFALLPLGAGVVWAPAAVWLLVTGRTGRGIALIVIGVGAISMIDNFLRPILLAGRTEMNGLLVLISLIGGLTAFGLLGLVLGPVIMATTISLVDAYAAGRRKGELPGHGEGENDRRSHA